MLVIPEVLFLVEQVSPRAAQIDNLRTPIAVFLETRALEAVERVADPLTSADDALVLVVAEGTFVADAHQGGGPHVGVAHWTLAVTLIAKAPDGNSGLLTAHDKVTEVVRES
ncbi:hypothetical protein K3495_g9042 [Podosphaera aphanis]|nr:hypothetical protein K3495_g9042 [Podosphaera aphanis]